MEKRVTKSQLIRTAKEAGIKYLWKALNRYDKERESANYFNSEKHADYFIQGVNFHIYAIKIVISLVYIIYNNLDTGYETFKEANKVKGDKDYADLYEEMLSSSDYSVIYLRSQIRKEYLENSINYMKGADKKRYVNTRINQGPFRDVMLSRFNECAVCGMTLKDALIVSHIKAWSKCAPEEKTDVHNALLLCPNHDKLFDRHLISFDDDGKIMISNKINESDRKLLCVSNKDKLRIEVNNSCQTYLKLHRNLYIEAEKKMNS